MMRTNISKVLALGAVALTAACASGGTASSDAAAGGAPAAFGASAEMLAEGRRLFQGDGRCGVCHGPTGAGGRLAPSLTDNQWIWLRPESPDFKTELMTIIRVGIPNPRQYQSPMPAMGGAQLFEAQIEALAAYVASL